MLNFFCTSATLFSLCSTDDVHPHHIDVEKNGIELPGDVCRGMRHVIVMTWHYYCLSLPFFLSLSLPIPTLFPLSVSSHRITSSLVPSLSLSLSLSLPLYFPRNYHFKHSSFTLHCLYMFVLYTLYPEVFMFYTFALLALLHCMHS